MWQKNERLSLCNNVHSLVLAHNSLDGAFGYYHCSLSLLFYLHTLGLNSLIPLAWFGAQLHSGLSWNYAEP
ncbi:uncharacterized protein EI90DRAFT_3156809 [Cantharellus anzutake]|uniref:uncharacterized protein n=1 Tax=Cantharellus anzutake TaxID=1750568 RepID=UPI0019078397|nr:uncharacterized protein EI90DRAFT_3156809 [Cantharellus anzutake]KAF8325779.1 hypothetical protein EI90DRAFT_3156809 [Cantharellus anzutake]